MSEDEFDRSDVIVSDRWRFTAAPTTVMGLHGSVLLGVLFLIPAVWLGIFRPVLILWVGYVAFVIYLKAKWKISPFDWFGMMFTRFVRGNKWLVR